MRFIFALACITVILFQLTTAFPHPDRLRRGPVDLSGLTGPGGMSFICICPPCPIQPIVLPPIDWETILAGIAQWNQQQAESSALPRDP